MTVAVVIVFLAAIVIANLSVAAFGQAALPVTAFVLIPFDLVTRDLLHERWKHNHLWLRMFALIAGGSVLSYLCSPASLHVAVASTAAFSLAGIANALVYHLFRHHNRMFKMNISNAVAALMDSIVFPMIAFASVDYWLSATQAGSKFIGGLFWSVVAIQLFKWFLDNYKDVDWFDMQAKSLTPKQTRKINNED